MTPNTTYICTRPRLAAELIAEGHPHTLTQNPWNAKYTAWAFPMTQELAMTVARYYNSIGKPAPTAIGKFLQEKAVTK